MEWEGGGRPIIQPGSAKIPVTAAYPYQRRAEQPQLPPDEVFRPGGAYCPEHDKALLLTGIDSTSSVGDWSLSIMMACPEGHELYAKFETDPEQRIMFSISYE